MPAPSDLVHETSTSTGTGNLTLVNVNGKRSFNTAFGTGGTDLFDYFISNQSAAEWERGTGHLSAASTLVRDTVLASSNAGAAVNFSAGTKDVTNDIPAANQARLDAAQTWSAQQTFSSAVNLTAGQIVFPGTAVPSAGANTLDDYEEGTWTPTIAGATTAGTQTYSIQVGHYTKIGNVVIATCNIELSAKDAATNGAMRIRGLPFTSKNVTNLIQSVAIGAYGGWDLNAAGGYTHMAGAISVNDVDIALVECGDNVARAALTEADFSATSTIRATVMYLV